MTMLAGSYPYQVPIDAYGNGGFRFADMSHRGEQHDRVRGHVVDSGRRPRAGRAEQGRQPVLHDGFQRELED